MMPTTASRIGGVDRYTPSTSPAATLQRQDPAFVDGRTERPARFVSTKIVEQVRTKASCPVTASAPLGRARQGETGEAAVTMEDLPP